MSWGSFGEDMAWFQLRSDKDGNEERTVPKEDHEVDEASTNLIERSHHESPSWCIA